MLTPIPLDLLPDTALVRVPDGESDRGGAFAEAVEVTNVRYERVAGIRKEDWQLEDGTTGRLWIDAIQSGGAFEVPAGSKVSVDGGKTWMLASRCKRLEDFDGEVHHWELELR